MELEPSTNFPPEIDRRRPLPPPPPVLLVSVEDARVPASAGLERELDRFYVGLLRFERDAKEGAIVYKAENFRLWMELIEGPIDRRDMRMLGVVVKSLGEAAKKFSEAEIPFTRERGVIAGEERLILRDPAGNWVRVVQSKPIM